MIRIQTLLRNVRVLLDAINGINELNDTDGYSRP